MQALRYKCLVLDHDDTVMDSTAHVHHPAFLQAMQELRPSVYLTLEEYFRMNFEPGFMPYCENVLCLTKEEAAREHEIWQSYVKTHIPAVFPGMDRIIRRQREAGGYVCVVSHSVDTNIRRDYEANGLPQPELVYGWELPRDRRKPSAYSLEQIMEHFRLRPEELLMVDDLKPGYDMAKSCGVAFAAAGWAYDIPEIREFMQQNCDSYFSTPAELESFLFG